MTIHSSGEAALAEALHDALRRPLRHSRPADIVMLFGMRLPRVSGGNRRLVGELCRKSGERSHADGRVCLPGNDEYIRGKTPVDALDLR